MNLKRHLDTLYACRLCPNVIGTPVTGAVPASKILLLGQAPGPHEMEQGRPFAYTAGRRLFAWFEQLGVAEAAFRGRVWMAAVIRCFPGKDAKGGGDRVPDLTEIANCGRHLDREIALLGPKLVIAVGTLAAAQLLAECELKSTVGVLHRASRAGVRFDVIVLPHPSGRSTWLNKPENRTLLDRSLAILASHKAWTTTFPDAALV